MIKAPIRTTFIYPPVPSRAFDWTAVRDDYEPGKPQGFGPTEQAAIDNLLYEERVLCDE